MRCIWRALLAVVRGGVSVRAAASFALTVVAVFDSSFRRLGGARRSSVQGREEGGNTGSEKWNGSDPRHSQVITTYSNALYSPSARAPRPIIVRRVRVQAGMYAKSRPLPYTNPNVQSRRWPCSRLRRRLRWKCGRSRCDHLRSVLIHDKPVRVRTMQAQGDAAPPSWSCIHVHAASKSRKTKGTASTFELEPTVNPVSRRALAEEHCPQISMHPPLAQLATAASGSAMTAAKCQRLVQYRPPWAIVLSHRRP